MQTMCTSGKIYCLSEPTSTLQMKQLHSPLRSKYIRVKSQLNQAKQFSGPERSSKTYSNPYRRYYVPSLVNKT